MIKMVNKYQKKYRSTSARMQKYDYGQNGAYFVTICTKEKHCYFGDVRDGKVQLNDMGAIAEKCWCDIPHHFPFVEIDVYVIMPNHIHGIIIIQKDYNGRRDAIHRVSTDDKDVKNCVFAVTSDGVRENAMNRVSTKVSSDAPRDAINRVAVDAMKRVSTMVPDDVQKDAMNRATIDAINRVSTGRGGVTRDNNPMLHQSLGRIVRWYKGRCAFDIRKIHSGFAWQPRFWDRVIRTDRELQKIREYIDRNPLEWHNDRQIIENIDEIYV